MDKEQLKQLVIETKIRCLNRCNNCNTKYELIALLFNYKDIVKDYNLSYKLPYIFNNDINGIYKDFIIVYVYSYFIDLINTTIKIINTKGLSSSYINHFERYCHERLYKLLDSIDLL